MKTSKNRITQNIITGTHRHIVRFRSSLTNVSIMITSQQRVSINFYKFLSTQLNLRNDTYAAFHV